MKEQARRKPEVSRLGELALLAKQDSEKWYLDASCVHSIPHHTLALVAEIGDFADVVQKIERGSLRIGDATVRHALAMKLTEGFAEVLNLAALLDIDLEKTYMIVRSNNDKRFAEERTRRESNGLR